MAGLKLHIVVLMFVLIAVTAVEGGHRRRDRGHKGNHHDRDGDSSSSEERWGDWDGDSYDKDDEWYEDEHRGEHHRGGHHEGHHWWRSSHGVGAIIGIVIGSVVVLMILGCVVRKCCAKHRKDRVSAYKLAKIAGKTTFPPSWTSSLVYKPELSAGFGDVSDGFMRIGASQIVKSRPDTNQTDGAKWAVGMTNGKHLFEVTWRWAARGKHATIGLATAEAPLRVKGEVPLVGGSPQTWGLDIVKRRTMHDNESIVNCPTDGSYVPDKFLMYVDMDEGTIGYGNDVTYWGEVVVGLPTQGEPLYLMVGATKWQSEVCINYLGSAPGGDDEKTGMRPPHHLPPLFHVAPTNSTPPPTYREMDEKNGLPADMLEAAARAPIVPPIPMENPGDLPPPYTRPPVGNGGDKY